MAEAKENEQQEQQNEDARLQELLMTPMTEDEVKREFADIDVRKMQLQVVRQKWLAQIQQLQLQISSLDTELYTLEMHKAVVFRRALNAPVEEKKED